VSGLVLKPGGAFEYIFGGEVRKIDAGGAAVLDPGPGIDPASLARSGSIVHRLKWRRSAGRNA
jgi:hypothetical protein